MNRLDSLEFQPLTTEETKLWLTNKLLILKKWYTDPNSNESSMTTEQLLNAIANTKAELKSLNQTK